MLKTGHTHVNTMDEFCLRVKKTQVFCHDYRRKLPYKFFAALDLLLKVTEGRAGQN